MVDTAGFEGTRDFDEANLSARHLNKSMVQDMLRQTRNALIYSDLALFMLDARQGIDNSDVALYKWLTDEQMRIRGVETRVPKISKMKSQIVNQSKNDEDFFRKVTNLGEAETL